MKVISLIIAKVLAVIAVNVTFIWIIVEFLIYLVKDIPFNWWSIWSFVISVIVAIVLVIIPGVLKSKIARRNMTKERPVLKKSKWQHRMEEMQSRQKLLKEQRHSNN